MLLYKAIKMYKAGLYKESLVATLFFRETMTRFNLIVQKQNSFKMKVKKLKT